jgi:hypothetical protein
MHLIPKELDYLQDKDFLITKAQIIEKLSENLAQTQKVLQEYLLCNSSFLPPNISYKSFKISKGENYRNLPYLILDYPRMFQREDIFALRTMIWWGNEVSCTLHIQGEFFENFNRFFYESLPRLKAKEVYICVHPSPWEYHFGEDNYVLANEFSNEMWLEFIAKCNFLKITRKLPLDQIAGMGDFALDSIALYREILNQ